MFDYKPEHIVTYTAQLAPPELIGPVPEGIRANVYLTGGEAFGPAIEGKIRPGGGGWATIRTDGESGYRDFLAQKLPPSIPLRTNPRFWTAHPKYAWLNRTFCFGVGAVDTSTFTVTYDVYAVK